MKCRVFQTAWMVILGACSQSDVSSESRTPVDTTCKPITCTQLGKNCGEVSDGCGGILNCGTCSAGMECGAGEVPNVCANLCSPATCLDLDAECGSIDDGCGGTLWCGTCDTSFICNNNRCESECAPKTCEELGVECGHVDEDGCIGGSILDCGTCTGGLGCNTQHDCVSCTPGEWLIYQVLPTEKKVWNISGAVDNDGGLHVVYRVNDGGSAPAEYGFSPGPGSEFNVESLPGTPSGSTKISLSLSSDGVPSVGYAVDPTPQRVQFIRKNATADVWETFPKPLGFIYGFGSVHAMDSDGAIHTCYRDNFAIQYTTIDDSTWTTTASSDDGLGCALALDEGDMAHMLLRDGTRLVYVQPNHEETWVTEVIADDYGAWAQIFVNGADIHAAYVDGPDDQHLWYAKRSGPDSWVSESVFDDMHVQYYSIAADAAGDVHMAFYTFEYDPYVEGRGLRYARRDATTGAWTTTTLFGDEFTTTNYETAIATGPDRAVYVFFKFNSTYYVAYQCPE